MPTTRTASPRPLQQRHEAGAFHVEFSFRCAICTIGVSAMRPGWFTDAVIATSRHHIRAPIRGARGPCPLAHVTGFIWWNRLHVRTIAFVTGSRKPVARFHGEERHECHHEERCLALVYQRGRACAKRRLCRDFCCDRSGCQGSGAQRSDPCRPVSGRSRAGQAGTRLPSVPSICDRRYGSERVGSPGLTANRRVGEDVLETLQYAAAG